MKDKKTTREHGLKLDITMINNMKRIILIVLWVIVFYFVFSMIGGSVIGILIGFTDYATEENIPKLVGLSNIFMLLGLVSGLILGIKEVLPGTKK